MHRLLPLSVTLLLWLLPFHGHAQWDAPFSRFWTVKGYANPSFAGQADKISVAAAYKLQWTNIDQAPRHYLLSADMPLHLLGKRHGIALLTHSVSVGDRRNSLVAAQYAYKITTRKGTFAAGIQAGWREIRFDEAAIDVAADSLRHNRKTIRTREADKKALDLAAGISWQARRIYLGAAVSHINQPRYHPLTDSLATHIAPTDSLTAHIPRSYNFIAACNITAFHPLIVLQPMVLVRTGQAGTSWQGALLIEYDNRYSAGAAWHSRGMYSLYAGMQLRGLRIGYAYDLHTAGIGKESGGSHEVSLSYDVPVELFARKPQPHKSIRLL